MPPTPRSAAPARAAFWLASLLLAGFCLVFSASARAGEAAPASEDPALEKRVMQIAAELRCLVCQNQTIADSHAELAIDLRNQVRDMLRKGQSQDEILAYMTARYGDFVLYRPPLKQTTAMLWFGPGLLLLGGVAALVVALRRRARLPDDQFEADEDAPEAPADAAPGSVRPATTTQ
jgi:cytochrome c-type biogenesis protein CcmH